MHCVSFMHWPDDVALFGQLFWYVCIVINKSPVKLTGFKSWWWSGRCLCVSLLSGTLSKLLYNWYKVFALSVGPYFEKTSLDMGPAVVKMNNTHTWSQSYIYSRHLCFPYNSHQKTKKSTDMSKGVKTLSLTPGFEIRRVLASNTLKSKLELSTFLS